MVKRCFYEMRENNNGRVVVNTDRGLAIMYDENDPRYADFARWVQDLERFIHLVDYVDSD